MMVPKLKRWYAQTKDSAKYFHVSSNQTKAVKEESQKLGINFMQFKNPPDVHFA
jgi:predicted HAD superfamily phosphohydrolase YqeG